MSTLPALSPDYSGRKCLPFWSSCLIIPEESAYPSGAEPGLFREKVPTLPVLSPDYFGRKCIPFRSSGRIIPGKSVYSSSAEPGLFREKVPPFRCGDRIIPGESATLPLRRPDYSGKMVSTLAANSLTACIAWLSATILQTMLSKRAIDS